MNEDQCRLETSRSSFVKTKLKPDFLYALNQKYYSNIFSLEFVLLTSKNEFQK